MIITNLAYPGILIRSNSLRREAAKSINVVEDSVRANSGKPTPQLAKLAAFFQACATAVDNVGKPKA